MLAPGAGAQVVCLDNFLTGTPANVAHLVGRDDFRLLQADLTDFVHVPAGLTQSSISPRPKARLLLASTSEVCGDPQVHPQPEDYGATSTPSAHAGYTTRPSVTPRP